MLEILTKLADNYVLKISALAWVTAQIIKIPVYALIEGKIDFKRIIGAGGMPSSHSALVVAMAVSTGRSSGWDSTLFALAAVLAAIVMFDAAGVRREAGKQAEIINHIISDIYHGTQISQERLKELIGHSPFEVLAGAILGLFIGTLFN